MIAARLSANNRNATKDGFGRTNGGCICRTRCTQGAGTAQMRAVILIGIPAPGVWMPATIVLTLALAAGIACSVPARRALGIKPAEALSRLVACIH